MNIAQSERENARLIRRFTSQKDVNALDALFDKYREKLYAYHLSSVRESSQAKDLVQDTFLKVLLSLQRGQYRDDGRFEPWLIRIARNVLMDHYREKKRSIAISSDPDGYLVSNYTAGDSSPEQQLIFLQRKARLRELIQSLPEPQRQVVILRHFVGLSFQEIADHTDVSINTALGRMRYALINMRKLARSSETLVA